MNFDYLTNNLTKVDINISKLPSDVIRLNCDLLTTRTKKLKNHDIGFHYNVSGGIQFEVDVELSLSTLLDSSNKNSITLTNGTECNLINVRSISSSSSNYTTLKFIPQKNQIRLGAFDGIKRVECTIVDGPSTYFDQKPIVLNSGGICIRYREFPDITLARKNYDLAKDRSAVTGKMEFSRLDGTDLLEAEYRKAYDEVVAFFRFSRGTSSGFGHFLGFDSLNQVRCADLGFTKNDQGKCEDGWSNIEIVDFYQEIFVALSSALSESKTKDILELALNFYSVSNSIRNLSPEMSLVASYTALETLIPHILQSNGGWSANLMKSSVAFHDKIRAAASLTGLSVDPLEHSPQLVAKKKGLDDADAFELLSVFRNRLVHQGKQFSYTGTELFEIWQISQWLCELMIFFVIGYRKKMMDRRRYIGFRGPDVDVPLR